MDKYINREALIESIRNGSGTPLQKLFAECCVRASDADVVEVVRCKDCKHWAGEEKEDYLIQKRWGECHRPFGAYGCENSTENDFCSYGERRGGHD